jgi:hypothetical protein
MTTTQRTFSGFTLIEALTLLFLFSVITTTFYGVFAAGTRQIIETKNRLGALALANEKMEIVRNLDYDAIGTKKRLSDGTYSYGIPAGEIEEDESVTANTRTFAVHTFVQYVDDAFDGTVSGASPVDTVPNDYRRVKIEVSWGAGGSDQRVALVATFAPKGLETMTVGGGMLSLNILESSGASVAQASVHIVNTNVTPRVDVTTSTDSSGNLMLPGAPAATQSYAIEVSKNGSFPIRTYAPYPTTPFQPRDVHASVAASVMNQRTLLLDKASEMRVITETPLGERIPNIDVHLSGGRILGDTVATSEQPSVSEYSLDQDFRTDENASAHAGLQSVGVYTVTVSDSRYRILRVDPGEALKDTFSLSDGEAKTIHIALLDKRIPSVLVVVNDQSNEAVVAGASVRVTNASIGYDATLTTDQYGQAFVPESAAPLVSGTYAYTVDAPGYREKTGTVVVADELKTEDVSLTAS